MNCEARVTVRTICLMMFGLCLWSAETWTRQRAADVEIFTRLGPTARAELLSALGETREALDADLIRLPETALAVRVLVERTERELGRFKRFETAKGLFQSGTEFDYLALVESHPELLRVARHEMVHRHLMRSSRELPQWLEEGLAEYYSTLARSGTEVEAGREIEAHLRTLASRPWLTAEQIFRVASTEELEQGALDVGVFYAQSWAMVHMLRTSPKFAAGFPRFFQLMSRGIPQDEAFLEAYGGSLKEALNALDRYLRAVPLARRRLTGIAARAPLSPAPAPEEELAALRADIHLAIGNLEEADPILRDLRDEGSTNEARRVARQAMLALRQQDRAEAERLFRQAIQLGSRDPVVWFESGMLARDLRKDMVEAERCLRRATALAPRFAHAWAELGWLEEARGAFADAVLHFRKASSIDPRNFVYLEALAVALRKAGAASEAEEAAQLARAAARTAAQRDQMEGLLRKWQEEGLATRTQVTAPTQVKAGAPLVTAPDVSRTEGLLIRIECPDTGIVFVLQRGSEQMRLEARDPSQVQMAGNGAGRQFACGEQKPPMTVEAEFSPTPPGQAGRGRLLRLSIRN